MYIFYVEVIYFIFLIWINLRKYNTLLNIKPVAPDHSFLVTSPPPKQKQYLAEAFYHVSDIYIFIPKLSVLFSELFEAQRGLTLQYCLKHEYKFASQNFCSAFLPQSLKYK